MITLAEQLSLAAKAVLDAQLVSAAAVAEAAFDSGVTMTDLNVEAAKTCMAAYTVAANQLLSIKDPQEWMSMTASQSQLALDRVHAYSRQAADIAHDAQAKFARVTETEIAASQQKVSELVDVVKQAPTVMAKPINSFLKTAFQTAHEGYDNFTSPVRAAAESLPSGSGAECSERAPM
jgi:phasin family protein